MTNLDISRKTLDGELVNMDGLTDKQVVGLAHLLDSPSVSEASRRSNINKSTLWGWLAHDSNFLSKYREARELSIYNSLSELYGNLADAARVIKTLTNDPDAASKRGARIQLLAAETTIKLCLKGVGGG